MRVYEGEASGQQRTQGGTLDLHDDSGQVALQRAGLLEAFRAVARHEGQEARTGDPWSGVITTGGFGPEGSKDKPEIDRGDLRQLLMDALPADAVQWGHRLTELVPAQAGGHRLRFANGVEHEADIVIGADGAWSKVRAALSACQPLPTGITFSRVGSSGQQPTSQRWSGRAACSALAARRPCSCNATAVIGSACMRR